MTIGEWLQDATKKLTDADILSARLDAMLILEHVLDSPRAILLAHSETKLPATTMVKLNTAIALRRDNVPVAYIVNKKEFYGRDFVVNEHVLVPRPETESFIELIKQQYTDKSCAVLDVGTGSGCIAITVALELPHSKVWASDISPEALAVAQLNAKHLGAQVTFKQSDLLDVFAAKPFDAICANLPYVPNRFNDAQDISKEPLIALFSGDDGLDHYRKFFSEVSDLAHKPKLILTEALESQHDEVEALANNAGYSLLKTDILVQLFAKN